VRIFGYIAGSALGGLGFRVEFIVVDRITTVMAAQVARIMAGES
jgi:hypothetical protein